MERDILYQTGELAAESRVVELRVGGAAVELLERTEGPDTEMVYGDPVHVTVLQLGLDAQAALLQALKGDSLTSALQHLFAVEEGAWLSDVQDILDRLGASYTRVAYAPGGVLYRPPYYD